MSGRPSRLPATGVFGGTFNPIHVGHLRAAEEVAEALELERVIFVPSAQPPHKIGAPGDPMAPAALRLAWVQTAIAQNPRFEVDPLEVEREGPSYSVDTLRILGQRLQPGLPVFLIGCDAFAELGSWRDPAALLALAHMAVVSRPPARLGRLSDWLPRCARDDVVLDADGRAGHHREAGTWLRLLEIPGLDVSASDIRRRLREGRSVRYLLPEAVRGAVEESGAYTGR